MKHQSYTSSETIVQQSSAIISNHISSKHSLSHGHKSRQHHVPKQSSQGGGRGDKNVMSNQTCLPINLFKILCDHYRIGW